MQLLSWMHRKLQKDATSSLQTLAVGSSCTCLLLKPSANNQGDYTTPGNDSIQRWQPKQQCQHRLKELNVENTEVFNEKQSTEIFPGFLTIGTLSVEPISEAPTPTFDLPHQVTNESGMAEMTYDLKLINEALEKFLKVEAEKEGNTESSRKNSDASTITLSQEVPEDVTDHNSVKKQVYPLQGYLLGSSNDHLETKPKGKKEKASFYKLFKKSTILDRSSIKETEGTHNQAPKEIKSSDHLMNKILQPTQTSPNISKSLTDHAAESYPTMRKLNKINQLFHKKVHPEISKAVTAAKEPMFSKNKNNTLKSSASYVDTELGSERGKISCWGTLKKGKKHCSKTDMILPQDAITKKYKDPLEDTSGGAGREHWINTDEEYFVLELQQNEGVQG